MGKCVGAHTDPYAFFQEGGWECTFCRVTDPQSSKPMAAAARKTRRARPSRSSTRISPATSRSRLTTRRAAPTLAPRKRTAKKAPRATTTAKRAKTGTSSKPKPRATIKRSARSAATAVAARTTTSSRRRRRRAALANCSDFYDRGKCIQRSCSYSSVPRTRAHRARQRRTARRCPRPRTHESRHSVAYLSFAQIDSSRVAQSRTGIYQRRHRGPSACPAAGRTPRLRNESEKANAIVT